MSGPCRFCSEPLQTTMVDLGVSPLCESFLLPEDANRPEPFYPLHAYVCSRCFLVQVEEYAAPDEIFDDYAYFSSFSDSWVEHARQFVQNARRDLALGPGSFVLEVASNDGYLLRHFVESGIPCLGIEPARTVAEAAASVGVPTRVAFFDVDFARQLEAEGLEADLIVANNVLAQVSDLNGFVGGFRHVLKRDGVLTVEFPHLLRLIAETQFDTIYHEHFSYFSLSTASPVFEAHGLRVIDCEELPTHGGSLRLSIARQDSTREVAPRVDEMLARERAFGLLDLQIYESFGNRVETRKREILRFLIDARESGRSVAGYGAPGKGNTLLNYCGIRTDLLEYTVDRNPYKHGRLTPGTRIPIFPTKRIAQTKPDYVFILPWNLRQEIIQQLSYIRDWGGEFVIPIPELEVIRP